MIQDESRDLEPEEVELLICILNAHPFQILYWSAACALDSVLLRRSNRLRGKLPRYVYRGIMAQMPGSSRQHERDAAGAIATLEL